MAGAGLWMSSLVAAQLASRAKKAFVAVTAGVPEDYFTLEGQNGITLETLLSNWGATLRQCQFDIEPMVTLYSTSFGLSDEDLALAGKHYRERLAAYAA